MISAKFISNATKFFIIAGLFCLVIFGSFYYLYFKKIVNLPFDLTIPIIIFCVASIVFLVLGFLNVIFNYLSFKNNYEEKTSIGIFLGLETCLIALFLPIYLFFKAINPFSFYRNLKSDSFFKIFFKRLGLLLFAIFTIPVWAGFYYLISVGVTRQLNYYVEPVPISGTGSMYPTFPKGESKTPQEQAKETVGTPGMMPYPNGLYFRGKRYFDYKISHGDIVVFENNKTKEITQEMYGEASGFVKRVIALPGDTIEIRDGQVILNNVPLMEPYIAHSRSTFGGETLSDCKILKIPEDKIFVMGDNRVASGDSRYELGLISFEDINHVLPFEKQKGVLDKNWRDTSNDLNDSAKIQLNKEDYLKSLNQKRLEAKLQPLKSNSKLDNSAQLRAQNILKFNDFSFEATRSGFTTKKAMDESGYTNIIWGEAPTNGYYDAQELLDNYFEFAGSKKFMLNKDYQDIGIGEAEGLINGCPAKVIVQHFGGYIPPNYKKDEIQGWQDILNNLKQIQPGWQSLKNYAQFYDKNKNDIDRLNDLIAQRISNVSKIVNDMQANHWLSKEEVAYTYKDDDLYNEQQSIAQKLNSQRQ